MKSIQNWFGKLNKAAERVVARLFRLPDPAKTINEKTEVSIENRRILFREFVTERIANGWSIEIENEFDVVLSKKSSFHWFGKLIIFLILLVVFFPVAIFYLAVVLIRGITKGPVRMRFSID